MQITPPLAAWAAAWAAVGNAVWTAAAWAADWPTVGNAEATGAAAVLDAVRNALKPTSQFLQQSALVLVNRMIDSGVDL